MRRHVLTVRERCLIELALALRKLLTNKGLCAALGISPATLYGHIHGRKRKRK